MQECGTGAGFSGVNNQQFANPQHVQSLHNPYESTIYSNATRLQLEYFYYTILYSF